MKNKFKFSFFIFYNNFKNNNMKDPLAADRPLQW